MVHNSSSPQSQPAGNGSDAFKTKYYKKKLAYSEFFFYSRVEIISYSEMHIHESLLCTWY